MWYDNPMRILSISSDRKVFKEGSEVRSRLLEYGYLVEEMHVIVFAKKSLGLRAESFPPNIFLYPTNTRTRVGYVFSAIKEATELKRRGVHIDVVTAQDPFESGLTAYLISRILRAKLHLQIHTDFMSPYFESESFLNRIRVLLAKFLLPRANAVRVVSERVKKSISKIVRNGTPVAVLPIFINTSTSGTSRDLKKNYPQFEKHILMASRLSPEKNIPLAIKAMKEIVAKYPKAGLIIVGSGSEEKALNLKAETCNLKANIIFEGWQDDLASYYKTADLFLLTSNYEGYGMAVVEAISAGCPVVMTDVGCAGGVVQSGKNGLVVPVGDEKALTEAVCRVLSGEVHLEVKPPKLTTKKEYLASYSASWEDALV